MVRVTKVDDQSAPPWEAVKARLLGLQDGKASCLTVDEETWLIVLPVADLGYLVTGCGEADQDYYTLVEPALGDEPVTAFDGGNTNDYPRYAFVSGPLLLKAAETYCFTGKWDASCHWVLDHHALY